jgi:hypothetical protein
MSPMIGMKVLNKKPLGNYMDIRIQRKDAMGEAKQSIINRNFMVPVIN